MRAFILVTVFVVALGAGLALKPKALDPCSVNEVSDGYLEDFYAILPEDSELSSVDAVDAVGFEAVLESVLLALSGEGREAFSFFLFAFGFSVVCAAAGMMDSGGVFGLSDRGCEMAVSVICSLGLFKRLYSVSLTVKESLISVADFFSALIPVVTAITSASGEAVTASRQAINMTLTLGIVGRLSVSVLMPLALALFALAVIGSVGDGGTAALAKGIKGIFMWGMGIISAICTAAVAIQSLVASAADSAALRAARYAASGLIPVVGSTVSAALSTLAGGLAFVKSSVGALSVAVILSLVVAPLVSLLLYRLVLSVCIIFLGFVDNTGGVRCFSAFRSALDAITAVYTLSTLVCIVQIVIFMKSGVRV